MLSHQPKKMDLHESVARSVAFITRHCNLPIHLSCVRRLIPELFSISVARHILVRAAFLCQEQQQALRRQLQQQQTGDENERETLSLAGDTIKLNQQGKQPSQDAALRLTCVGFFQTLERVSNTTPSSGADTQLQSTQRCCESFVLRTRISELPRALLLQQHGCCTSLDTTAGAASSSPAKEVINLMTMAPAPSSGSLEEQQQLQRQESQQTTLAGIWMTDRSVLDFDSNLAAAKAMANALKLTAADDSRIQQQQEQRHQLLASDQSDQLASLLSTALSSCAWRLDLKAMMSRVGLDNVAQQLSAAARAQRHLNVVTSKQALPSHSSFSSSNSQQQLMILQDAEDSKRALVQRAPTNTTSTLPEAAKQIQHVTITRRVSAAARSGDDDGDDVDPGAALPSHVHQKAADDTSARSSSSALSLLANRRFPFLAAFPRDARRFAPLLQNSGGSVPASSSSTASTTTTTSVAVFGEVEATSKFPPLAPGSRTNPAAIAGSASALPHLQHLSAADRVVVAHRGDGLAADTFSIPRRRLRDNY